MKPKNHNKMISQPQNNRINLYLKKKSELNTKPQFCQKYEKDSEISNTITHHELTEINELLVY